MTIANTSNVDQYTGTGLVSEYAFTFLINLAADLVVYYQPALNGPVQQLVLNTDYSVGPGNTGVLTGGDIVLATNATFPAGVLPYGAILTLVRDPAETQLTVLQGNGPAQAPAIENMSDLLTMQMQAVRTLVNNAIRIPVVESLLGFALQLPLASARASKYLGFDGSGNIIALAPNNASGTAVTATGSNTPRFLADRFAETIDPLDYGAMGNGVTDDTAAMAYLFSLLTPGMVIDFKSRNYILASASLAALPAGALKLPCSNLTLKGDRAVFTVTGTTPCGILYSPGLSNIHIRGLVLAGNTECSANTINNGTGIVFTTESATSDISNLRVEDCEFSGFMSQGAICFESLGTTYNMRKVGVTGCRFVGGDVYQPTNTGTITAAIYFGTNTSGSIYDIIITDNIIDGTMMKSGVQFVGNNGSIFHALIKGNSIYNVGSNYASTIVNSYAIACKPNCFKFTITGNIIGGAVDCGIYAYSGGQFSISGNYIENVTTTDDSVLLRGAIVCNQPNSSITGNSIVGCYFGIQVQGPAAGGIANITVSGNSVQAQRPLTLKYNVAATASHISVVGNIFDATSGLANTTQAVIFQDTGTPTLDNVTISDNDIVGYIGITDYSQTANGWNRMSILGNRITQLGAGSGIALEGSGWQDCAIERNTVYASATAGISISLQGQGADINASIVGNTVRNNTNGSARAYETGGTRGIFKDNQAINCTKIIYNSGFPVSGILGLQIPLGTVGMTLGDFVQYIGDPQAGYGYNGSGGTGKVLRGWVYDGGGWHPIYMDRDVLVGSITFNPGSVGVGANASTSVSVPGAIFGDYVDVAAPYSLGGLTVSAAVNATNGVTITVANNSGAPVVLGSGTWIVRVTPGT